MNIDFPNNPVIGQVFTSGGTNFRCVNVNPNVWTATPAADPIPDGPVDGHMWGRKDATWNRAVDLIGDTMTGPLGFQDAVAPNYHSAVIKLDNTGLNIGNTAVGTASAPRINVSVGVVAKPQLVLDAAVANWNLNGMAMNANPGSSAELTLNKNTGATSNNIWGLRNGSIRWIQQLGNEVVESGSGNAGSDYVLNAYSDAGAYLKTALRIMRSSSIAIFGGTSLNIAPAAGDSLLKMDRSVAASTSAIITGSVTGLQRWNMILGASAAETGSNAGSDFYIQRCNDAGAYLGNVVHIARNTGTVELSNDLSVAGNLYAASGMGFLWDGGGFNYLRMGANSTNWSWQWNRSTGLLNWLGGSSNVLASINGSGGITGVAFSASGATGYTVTGVQGDGSTYALQSLVIGNPSWATCDFRSRHQFGQWAGWEFIGNTDQVRFSMASGTGWGEIMARAFTVQSDERDKDRISYLAAQHEAFSQIKPIEWYWPIQEQKVGDFPLYVDTRAKWGFSAQNVAKHIPLAVNGDIDAYDAAGKPITAMVDPVPIMALTVLEVQALIAKVSALEERVVQLEGAKT